MGNNIFSWNSISSWSGFYPAILAILIVVLFALIMSVLNTMRRKSQEATKELLQDLITQLSDLKSIGTIKPDTRIFYCPRCFLLSPSTGKCPNHDFPIEMILGNHADLEFYNQKQRLLRTEVPDDDDHDRRPWE